MIVAGYQDHNLYLYFSLEFLAKCEKITKQTDVDLKFAGCLVNKSWGNKLFDAEESWSYRTEVLKNIEHEKAVKIVKALKRFANTVETFLDD